MKLSLRWLGNGQYAVTGCDDTSIKELNLDTDDDGTNGKGKIVEIDNGAFQGYPNLNSVYMQYVEIIGDYAFQNCQNLDKIVHTGADNMWLVTINQQAFMNCQKLTIFDVNTYWYESDYPEEGVNFIGTNAFYGCANLKKDWHFGRMNDVGFGAFNGCNKMNFIFNSETINWNIIEANTFIETGITTINIPSYITSISNGAFRNCSQLTKVYLPNNTTCTYGSNIFSGTPKELQLIATDLDVYNYCKSIPNLSSYNIVYQDPNIYTPYYFSNGKWYNLLVDTSDFATKEYVNDAEDTLQAQFDSLDQEIVKKLGVDNIKAGDNITIKADGNNITINAEGGGGGGDYLPINNPNTDATLNWESTLNNLNLKDAAFQVGDTSSKKGYTTINYENIELDGRNRTSNKNYFSMNIATNKDGILIVNQSQSTGYATYQFPKVLGDHILATEDWVKENAGGKYVAVPKGNVTITTGTSSNASPAADITQYIDLAGGPIYFEWDNTCDTIIPATLGSTAVIRGHATGINASTSSHTLTGAQLEISMNNGTINAVIRRSNMPSTATAATYKVNIYQ